MVEESYGRFLGSGRLPFELFELVAIAAAKRLLCNATTIKETPIRPVAQICAICGLKFRCFSP
jgi:hypothetical protein